MYIDHDTLVEAAVQLPPLPNSVSQLMNTFRDPNYRLEDVARVVELDGALTGQLLTLANGAAHGQVPTSDARTAILRLGAGMVQAVAFASSIRPDLDMDLSCFGITVDDYWKHSLFVTAFAEELNVSKLAQFEEGFQSAAVIHDFGKLVMAKTLKAEHLHSLAALNPDLPESQREMLVLGVNHAEVTAVVCQHWGLSDTVVHAVQFHHDPDQISTPEAHGLHLANQLAWRFEGDPQRNYVIESKFRHRSMKYFGLDDDQFTELYQRGSERCHATLRLFR